MDSLEELTGSLGFAPQQFCALAQQTGGNGNWLFLCSSGRCWCSSQVYRMYGLSRRAGLTPEGFWALVCPEDREAVRAAFDKLQHGGSCRVVHRALVRGRYKWLEQSGRCYPAQGGREPYLVGVVRDVTRLKEEEARLAARRADLTAVTAYLAETTDTTDLRAIVSSVKRTIRKRMDVAVIGVFARQGERISRVIPRGMDPLQAFQFQSIQDYVGYQAVTEGARQVCPVEDYPSPLGREALNAAGGRSIISLPIKHGKRTIGALTVVIRRPGDLTRGENEFCRTICGYLSNQLYSALLYEQLKEELAHRRHLESDRETIFNESVDYITVIDGHGRFAQINPAFARRLGSTPQALLGRSIFDFIHPDDRAFALCTLREMRARGVVRGFCNRFVSLDGTVGYVENNLKYMENGSTIAIARDVTDQRRMEARNNALEASVNLERMKSELLAGISHEFKTPLNIVLSSLDLMRTKSSMEDPERFQRDYARFFGYAYENCYKLLRLTANLLDSSRMENGYFRLRVGRHRLGELLRDIVASAEVYANACGVTLYLEPVPDGALWLNCDADCVDRILLNLLSNAIKNTPEGGAVRVSLRWEADACRISVADDGCGIAPEVLPHIFDRFCTEQPSLSGRQDGSGLGLALAKALVELHGGEIRVESAPGQGSRFTFSLSRTLPLTEAGTPQAAVRREALNSRARVELYRLK